MNDGFPALRVIVADDHPVFRDGLAMILRERGVHVVAEAADGQAALDATAEHKPDVVLMDLVMPGLSGIEATRRLVAGYPAVAVLVLTMSEDDDSVFAALRGHCWTGPRRSPGSLRGSGKSWTWSPAATRTPGSPLTSFRPAALDPSIREGPSQAEVPDVPPTPEIGVSASFWGRRMSVRRRRVAGPNQTGWRGA